jgi:hypothetical protein
MENLIIRSLFDNIPYAKRVLPFLKLDYFETAENKLILQAFNAYTKQYNSYPTYSVIKAGIIQNAKLSESIVKSTFEQIEQFENEKQETFDSDWLFDQAEKHCQQYSLETAILESSSIIGDPERANAEISKMITNALRVSFNTDLGIDLFSKISMQECYDSYVLPHNKIECGLKDLDDVFHLLKRTTSCLLSPTHGGKCSFYNSMITIKCKSTQEIIEISIGDFYELQKRKKMNRYQKTNNRNL